MADELITAAQAEQESPTVKTEDQTLQGQETEVKATSESQGEEAEQSSSKETENQSGQQEAKPPRIERRVQNLLTKIRDIGQSQSQIPPERTQPLISQEDRDNGQLDPNVFEQRIQGVIKSEVSRAIQMDRIGQQYQSSIKEHQADLESVKDIDPELEAQAAADYEALNYQINPFTGQKEFIPAVKFSEIVSRYQQRAEKLAQKMAEQIAAKNEQFLKNVSSSQAVPSSGSVTAAKTVKPETTNFAEFEKAYSS